MPLASALSVLLRLSPHQPTKTAKQGTSKPSDTFPLSAPTQDPGFGLKEKLFGVSAHPVGCDQVEHRQGLGRGTMQAPNHLQQFRLWMTGVQSFRVKWVVPELTRIGTLHA